MKRRLQALLLVWCVCFATAARADDLDQGFASPPASDRPAVYAWMWPWEYPKEVLTRDLEEMKAQGISSFMVYFLSPSALFVSRGKKLVYGETENHIIPTDEYDGPGASAVPKMEPANAKPWSEQWSQSIRHMAAEAARLKLDFGLSLGPAGCNRDPLPEEYGAQILLYSATAAKGGARIEMMLPLSEKVALRRDKKGPVFYRDIAVLAVPAQGTIAPESVVDLTGKMDANGRLAWDAPAGEWSVLRFGHSAKSNSGALDHLSAEAFDRKWEQTVLPLLRAMSDTERAGLHFIECDSYEGGGETWTPRFPEEFRKRRGYDIVSWLPVLTGRVVGDKDRSARFERDYRLTISDLYAENHYARHTARAREAGLWFCAEAAGPHQGQANVLKSLSRCDVAMGEFWMPGTHRGTGDSNRFLLREAAAAAHGYGMGQVFCEAFTGGFEAWQESPFRMKPCADQAYCDGLTRPCIHGYSLSPWSNGEPGLVYGFGVYVNRHVTWWPQSHAFFDYLARCSFLSRQGVFSADVAYFTGELGRKFMRKDAMQPLIPPNSRSRGPYDYDHVNSEILLTRMSVRDGRIVLPDGLSYRLLLLDGREALSVPVLRKIAAMVEEGAAVCGTPPREPFGLMDDPQEFAALIERLWGPKNAEKSGEHALGKGKVVWGIPPLQVLADLGVAPDFECRGVSDKGRVDWIHRRTGDADIYYVANLWQPVEQIECVFRVSGKVPELWDPVTGAIREAGNFRVENGRTVVPLRLDAYGSVFVVFRKPTSETSRDGKNWHDYRPLQQLDGPWMVRFNPEWFYPKPAGVEDGRMIFETLDDWTRRHEPAVKYYSGRAVYEKEFRIATLPSGGRVFLDLGSVSNLAEVRVNGRDLGVLWTPPFRVDVTDAIRTGVNRLEIAVVNLWPNRLTGDTFLPEAQRRTRTNMVKYTQSSQLLPSGLLGPVTIQTKKRDRCD